MDPAPSILTERLALIDMTAVALRADLQGPPALAQATGCIVLNEWPPEHWDASGITYLLEYMARYPAHQGWVRFITLRQEPEPLLIGMCGTTMPIFADTETVEIGYSLLATFHGRGYGTEAVRAFVAWIFDAHPAVQRVEAQTFPSLLASSRVLEKAGFALAGAGHEAGTVLYRLNRFPGRGKHLTFGTL